VTGIRGNGSFRIFYCNVVVYPAGRLEQAIESGTARRMHKLQTECVTGLFKIRFLTGKRIFSGALIVYFSGKS
jgi:hypothetical protein